MTTTPSDHYVGEAGERYAREHFDDAMAFGRRYQGRRFAGLSDDSLVVLDFGCGDGVLLDTVPAAARIGVEVNPECRRRISERSAASGRAVEVLPSLDPVRDGSVDLAISNHSLEHVGDPLGILRELRRVLKPGARLAVVTPFDDWRSPFNRSWSADDGDHHLFTWSPRNLGNLLAEAGFEVSTSDIDSFAWSPRIFWVHRVFGERAFRGAGRLLARVRNRREVFALARRPLA